MSTDQSRTVDAPPAMDSPDLLDSVIAKTMAERGDLMQMRMENETIMAECRARPRDLGAIKRQLAALLKEFPDFARTAIYRKPVGKDDDGKEKFAEGLSVRAAEVFAELYRFNRIRSSAIPLDDDATRVQVEATFTDLQNGRIWQDSGVVSAFYKAKGGVRRRYSEDRFFNVVVKAQASIRVREVINRSVNAALKAWFENECRKTLAKTLDAETVDKIVAEFKALGVRLEDLEELVGKPKAMGWSVSDRITVVGIWTALHEGETTVAALLKERRSESEATDRHVEQERKRREPDADKEPEPAPEPPLN
ncbi:MAG TPA: hypothetical protein VMY37_28775, partial [Thermoguttaceae bacterium]|nr:hypothetical protein [Thermoguttaceae bacterium]